MPAAPALPAWCENCGAPLYGKYCYACGQPTHGLVRHFGSVLSDVADSVLNIDERLFRTLGPLYFRPGKLTLDYFEGKRARYVDVVKVGASPAANSSTGKTTEPGAKSTSFDDGDIRIHDKAVWNRRNSPLRVDWLPRFANDWINDAIEHARANLHALGSGTSAARKAEGTRLMLGMFSAAPTVLFFLLPVFALILKIFFIVSRRLYMEHLVVAMHSHAFLMLSMLVLVALSLLHRWRVPHAGWLSVPFWLLRTAAWVWIFVYLFMMQKRVYRQGKFMTALKYCCIGFCYTVVVGLATGFAFLIRLGGT